MMNINNCGCLIIIWKFCLYNALIHWGLAIDFYNEDVAHLQTVFGVYGQLLI